MPTEIISSRRRLQIWKYTVGHSQLLLRSTKSAEFPTSIEVFFKGVKEFHLPTVFTGLSITEASEADIRQLCSLPESPFSGQENKVFKVQGSDYVGYITAEVGVCHEDEGDYDDPIFFAKETTFVEGVHSPKTRETSLLREASPFGKESDCRSIRPLTRR